MGFQWTEELVHEFLCDPKSPGFAEHWKIRIKEFKQSKQPQKDYEILDSESSIGIAYGRPPLSKNIKSVKRLSDGQVFTVGDKDEYGRVITEFTEHSNEVFARVQGCNGSNGICSDEIKLNVLSKGKKPLFQTEDGVDIYIGDSYYSVTDDFEILHTTNVSYDILTHKPIAFSTEQSAENYIIENKPCLSFKDIVCSYNMVAEERTTLTKLVKSKLGL